MIAKCVCSVGQVRTALQKQARDADIVIMSYETLRSDVAWAAAQPWLYAVLDEGHTVRNSKSKTAQARPRCFYAWHPCPLRFSVSWSMAVVDTISAQEHLPQKLRDQTVLQACKAVVAAHRLILSGTPIQNSIGELWGLFDWLMPGFLGSEKAFQVRRCLRCPTTAGKAQANFWRSLCPGMLLVFDCCP